MGNLFELRHPLRDIDQKTKDDEFRRRRSEPAPANLLRSNRVTNGLLFAGDSPVMGIGEIHW